YYKGDLAPGAFAPAGWTCHSWYGSDSGTLLITPEVPGSRAGSVWPETSGPAVELELSESGRFRQIRSCQVRKAFLSHNRSPFHRRMERTFSRDCFRRVVESISERLDYDTERSPS